MRLIHANQATASKRRVYFDLRDATDGLTPETGEAGGQPQISTNGGAWTDTGIGTLTAIGEGRYYAELTQAAVATAGDVIETRYKSANTAESPGDSVQVVAFDPDDAEGLGLGRLDAAVSSRATPAAVGSALTSYGAPTTSDLTDLQNTLAGEIAGLNDLSAEDVESAVGSALTSYGALVAADLTDIADAIEEIQGAGFDTLEHSLTALRAYGDSHWATGGDATAADQATIMSYVSALNTRLTAARAGYLDNLNGHTPQTGDVYASLPDNFADLVIDASGHVSIAAISDAIANKVADHTLRRSYANARASTDGDAVSFRSLLGALAKLVNKIDALTNAGYLTVYHEDDTTEAGRQAITADADAEPITALDTQ